MVNIFAVLEKMFKNFGIHQVFSNVLKISLVEAAIYIISGKKSPSLVVGDGFPGRRGVHEH